MLWQITISSKIQGRIAIKERVTILNVRNSGELSRGTNCKGAAITGDTFGRKVHRHPNTDQRLLTHNSLNNLNCNRARAPAVVKYRRLLDFRNQGGRRILNPKVPKIFFPLVALAQLHAELNILRILGSYC